MTEEKVKYYKELLLKEKAAIAQSLSEDDNAARSMMEQDANVVGDSADEASVNISQSILNLTNNKNKETMVAIEAALRRIEEKTFGICVICGKEINPERLEALPWTTMCIGCKSASEKRR